MTPILEKAYMLFTSKFKQMFKLYDYLWRISPIQFSGDISTDIFIVHLTLQYIPLHQNEERLAETRCIPLPGPSRLSYTSETELHQRTHFLGKPHRRIIPASLERKTWRPLECSHTLEPGLKKDNGENNWNHSLYGPNRVFFLPNLLSATLYTPVL